MGNQGKDVQNVRKGRTDETTWVKGQPFLRLEGCTDSMVEDVIWSSSSSHYDDKDACDWCVV